MALTIFHVAFAALASTLVAPEGDEWALNAFETHANRTEAGRQWLVATGQLRTAGMAAEAQATLQQARFELLPFSSRREPPLPVPLAPEEAQFLHSIRFSRSLISMPDDAGGSSALS